MVNSKNCHQMDPVCQSGKISPNLDELVLNVAKSRSWGIGWGWVGRAVASDTIEHYNNVNYIEKTKIKEKEAGGNDAVYAKF